MKNAKLLIGALCAALLFASFISQPKEQKRTIVIDFGHGGEDKGAQTENLSEATILKDIEEQIKKESRTISANIIFIREPDQFMTLENRVKKINEINPDLLISLHVNSSPDKEKNGITGYVSRENPFYKESHVYALSLTYNLSEKTLNDRGVIDRNLYLIKNVKCPATMLELGFITNEGDRNYISSKMGQLEIARTICQTVR